MNNIVKNKFECDETMRTNSLFENSQEKDKLFIGLGMLEYLIKLIPFKASIIFKYTIVLEIITFQEVEFIFFAFWVS